MNAHTPIPVRIVDPWGDDDDEGLPSPADRLERLRAAVASEPYQTAQRKAAEFRQQRETDRVREQEAAMARISVSLLESMGLEVPERLRALGERGGR